ncbi:MAG: DUF47 domain-containing protein [Desulfovibrio sp.]
MRVPFFGLLETQGHMQGLTEHYAKIAECIALVNESLECYVSGVATCKDIQELFERISIIENEADRIKRGLRNHLPRSVFMAVEKTLYLNYTKCQDNIMDSAQDSLQWLAMRRMAIPAPFQKDLIYIVSEVNELTELLGPALEATIALVDGKSIDRRGTKEKYRAVRSKRDQVRSLKNLVISKIYSSDLDFKDIYQLMHFVDCLDDMAHNTESCADILRSMIAR